MMRLRQIVKQRWTVLAVCDDRGECQVSDFLDAVERDDKASLVQTTAILRQTADNGPPHNTQKSRPLADGIFELKTRSGVRIPYFYDAGQIVVCSAAMKKPKKAELDRVIERALGDRQRYFKAKRRNQIQIIEETP
jgi:hypothetical protein